MPESKTPRLVTMVATQRQTYGQRHLKSGEEFQVTEAEALDLVAMKIAYRREGSAARYQRRDLRATE